MKKTYINKIILALMLVISISSCKKGLELDPFDTLEKDKALLTSKDVEAAMVGTYSALGSRNFYGGRPFLMSDFLANTDAILWSGTYEELTQTINKSILVTNTYVNNAWEDGYKTINNANNILEALDKVEASKKDRIEGEAKFIRGMVHFDLVRFFGKAYNDGDPATNPGVPIMLTSTNEVTESSYVSRSTVAQVYTQAITDLTEAEAKLPETNGFFATKHAAAAVLARIYLQMGNYQAAAEAANRVISSNKFTLTSSYVSAFPELGTKVSQNTTEDVFAIQVNNLTGYNGYNEFYGSSTYSGRGDAVIRQSWIDATYTTPGDDRINAFYDDDDMFTSKYGNPYGNVSTIRLAEMYLIRAEANFRTAPTQVGSNTPVQDVNIIRTRAGITTPLSSVDLNTILNERKLELAFEGFALNDAKRTRTNIGSIAWNANSLVFPIPQIERDANKNLVQNPGYN